MRIFQHLNYTSKLSSNTKVLYIEISSRLFSLQIRKQNGFLLFPLVFMAPHKLHVEKERRKNCYIFALLNRPISFYI